MQSKDSLFLPDLCEIHMVFAVVLIGELFAIVLVLASISQGRFWYELGVVSLFVQWVGLASTALLCGMRNQLARLGNIAAGIVSVVLIMVVTLLLSEAAFQVLGQDLSSAPSPNLWHWTFLGRNLSISCIIGVLVLRYFYVQFQWKRNLELEARARFQALQSRIRPHFLFNTMNTIASLTRSRPAVAEQVVEDLTDLLRVSLGDAEVPATLEDELNLCRQYTHIEELRIGERLSLRWELDEFPPDALLPALTLQPLVENAIYHGIEPSLPGGKMTIKVTLDVDLLVVEIRNSIPHDSGEDHHHGNRIAQKNVQERFLAFFGAGSAGFKAGVDGGDYQVVLTFPYRKK
ncbi:MAG: sensor histidine kinase [Gammaproteobacteria bacterium]|nr:sensor histidine kinase [Gammaproteobacteria bacterium]